MMDHAELRELLDAYVLGALDGEEAAAVAAHLDSCEGCRAAVATARAPFGEASRGRGGPGAGTATSLPTTALAGRRGGSAPDVRRLNCLCGPLAGRAAGPGGHRAH